MRSTSELDNLIKYINMGKKKRFQGLSEEDKLMIEEKMSYTHDGQENTRYVDDYKRRVKAMCYRIDIQCQTEKQQVFYNHLLDTNKKVNICDAPAGVGKSFLALAAGLSLLKEGTISNVIIVVPTIEASETCRIGLLPGTIEEKLKPYTIAAMANVEKILRIGGSTNPREVTQYLFNNGLIRFELLSYARGRTLDDCFLILDEAENLSQKECLLLLTRIGDGSSKVALLGDREQCDRRDVRGTNACGLIYAADKLANLDEVTVDEFETSDIVRNPIITKILNAWNA